MDKLQQVYQEFGPNFCLSPFVAGHYSTYQLEDRSQSNNSVNRIFPCCAIDPGSTDHYQVIDSSLLKSRNTDRWRYLRQQFVNGNYQSIPDCQGCAKQDAVGTSSIRHGTNIHIVQHCKTDVVQEVKNIIANDFESDKILKLAYEPSNYCNFACIMCNPGASSGRLSYEAQFNHIKFKVLSGTADQDFEQVLESVEALNLAGGEPLLQTQIIDLLNHVVEKKLAPNMTLMVLTNASKFPEQFADIFSQFRRVIYMCSIDGVGSALEYQRRGAKWKEVEHNVLEYQKHNFLEFVVNCVLSAVTAPNIDQFLDWIQLHRINGVRFSTVEGVDYMGTSAMPEGLKTLALERLYCCRDKYQESVDPWVVTHMVPCVNQAIAIIENTPYNHTHYLKFKYKIQKEDRASKITLTDAVPDWAGYL